MSGAPLTADQVRFINLVAARRFGGGGDACPPPVALPAMEGDTPARRAAALGAALARPGTLALAALPTVLLAVCCQLRRDGLRLMAPQGAAAGMVRGLATGSVMEAAFAAWLEDRSVAL